ncbi:MAG: response regulator transcription factor [Dehalococcoidales bacterium]|nr:response regulator transcription factor [Dehalococcoidales bacterium]
MISVIVADDHPFIRKAIKAVIDPLDDIKVVAEASNGTEAVKYVTELNPDVVIMDIGMPQMNGLEATRKIKEKCPKTAVLILTVYEDSEHIIGLLKAGAAGYLIKDIFDDELVHSIYNVVAGETVLSSQVASYLIKYAGQPSQRMDNKTNLTAREMDVLKLAAKGKTNKEIGTLLQLSPISVKSCLSTLFSKLGVGSRTEAVIMGLRYGLLSLKDLED